MFSLLRDRKPHFTAQSVRKLLLFLQVALCLVELLPVGKRDRIGDHVKVEVVPVLVNPDEALVVRKELPGEPHADLKALLRRDRLVPVEADHVVGVHPSRLLSPQLLFLKERVVYAVPCDLAWGIGAGHDRESVPDLVLPKDVFYRVPHRPA